MKTTSSVPPSAEGSSKIRKNRGGLPKLPAGGLPPKVIDLRGRRFGRLLVQRFAGLDSKQRALWECRCDCGNAHTTAGIRLRYGTVNSCGCLSRDLTVSRRRQDLAGRKFGRLTVKSYHHTARSYAYWSCDCACGEQIVVSSQGLLAGRARSCGCFRRDRAHYYRGSRHPCWDAKLDQESRDKYRWGSPTQERFRQTARSVRTRDSNSCIVCGSSGCMLHVHHLETWAHAPALRYDPANLVTLCKDCHDQFHQLYGKDCDLDDFAEFMKE